MARTLEQRMKAGDPAPWTPEKAGDSIIGEIEAVGQRTGDYGPYTIITVLDNEGEAFNVAGFGQVLARKFEELQPQVGEKIGVQYLGEVKNKKGTSTYKNWLVMIDEPRLTNGTTTVPTVAAPADEVDEPF